MEPVGPYSNKKLEKRNGNYERDKYVPAELVSIIGCLLKADINNTRIPWNM